MEGAGRRLEQLERQLAAGWAWLRFASDLEPAFREQFRAWVMPFRVALIVASTVLVAVTPLLDRYLLRPPVEFMGPANFTQYAFMIPALLLALVCSRVERWMAWSDAASLLAVTVISAGLLFQRYLGSLYQVWLPTELVTAAVAGAFVMGGLRFWRMLALAVLLVISIGVTEFISYGDTSTTNYILFGVLVQIIIAGMAGYLLEHFARGTWLRREMLEILASRDALTGLHNFRAFDERYRQLYSLALREQKPILVVVLDLDFFKQYNDAYGHAAGNECLVRIAAQLSVGFGREGDIKARIGGEEFVLVMYNVDRVTAERMLEGLRAGIQALAIPHEKSGLETGVVTASLGAYWCSSLREVSADGALQLADRCLYEAKHAGRNRIVMCDGARPEQFTDLSPMVATASTA